MDRRHLEIASSSKLDSIYSYEGKNLASRTGLEVAFLTNHYHILTSIHNSYFPLGLWLQVDLLSLGYPKNSRGNHQIHNALPASLVPCPLLPAPSVHVHHHLRSVVEFLKCEDYTHFRKTPKMVSILIDYSQFQQTLSSFRVSVSKA